MRNLARTLFAISTLLGTIVPAAGQPRFHKLTPALQKRLSDGAQRTTRAVAKIGHATGFIVQRNGARALMLTNHHVAGKGAEPGSPIRFFDGTEGKEVRLVAKDAVLDYALLEVALSYHHPVVPLPLHGGKTLSGIPIYSVAAYAKLAFNDAKKAIGGSDSTRQAIVDTKLEADGYRGHFTIASGQLNGGQSFPNWMNVGGHRIKAVSSALPNSGGMSGSPIVSSTDHTVVGLHSAGGARPDPWMESSVPTGLIIRDLERKRAAGKIPRISKVLVDELLAEQR